MGKTGISKSQQRTSSSYLLKYLLWHICKHGYLLPPSSIFSTYLHANITEKKNQKASIRPSASRNNHDEVHETTIHMSSMIETTGNNKPMLQGQKLTTCWNPLQGLGKIWHELKGEWFYHAQLRRLPNPLPHCISIKHKHVCFPKLCQDILRIESQNPSHALWEGDILDLHFYIFPWTPMLGNWLEN